MLYTLVILSALLVRTPTELAASPAPLADVFAAATGQSPLILAAIGLTAIINGILVQLIMGSRILYGLASQGWISRSLAGVHGTSRTPILATLLIATLILIFALTFPLVQLAEFTSFLVLIVFTMVNLALIVIKRRQPPGTHFVTPIWVPVFGTVTALGLLILPLIVRT